MHIEMKLEVVVIPVADVDRAKDAAPGSVRGTYLIVGDIHAARAELLSRGAKVSEVFHRGVGESPQDGRDPQGRSYTSFASFRDPDGNSWLLQEIRERLPGRVLIMMCTASAANLPAQQRAGSAT
jgi:hypothetical protein